MVNEASDGTVNGPCGDANGGSASGTANGTFNGRIDGLSEGTGMTTGCGTSWKTLAKASCEASDEPIDRAYFGTEDGASERPLSVLRPGAPPTSPMTTSTLVTFLVSPPSDWVVPGVLGSVEPKDCVSAAASYQEAMSMTTRYSKTA